MPAAPAAAGELDPSDEEEHSQAQGDGPDGEDGDIVTLFPTTLGKYEPLHARRITQLHAYAYLA